MADAGLIIGLVFLALIIIVAIAAVINAVLIVKEKEAVIVERLGKFHCVCNAGMHFLIPFIDTPKVYTHRYHITNPFGNSEVIEKSSSRISTQNEVLDFPKQKVITRDNAAVYLDAVLSYKVVNPKQMVYSVQNLPHVLSKLLQAQLRNVAGSLEIDQIIEESASLNVLTGLMDEEAMRWGVKVQFVKIQRVDALGLQEVLAKKKNADLQNKEVIIGAKATKQTEIIEAEGLRDSMIKRAEGEQQETLSRARGAAQATINQAKAEARSIREIARALSKQGENPSKYLLALKYLDALQDISNKSNTRIQYLPKQSSTLQTITGLGLNTLVPPARK